GPLAPAVRPADAVPAQTGTWSADHREVTVTSAPHSRVLVVPESVNPGWSARSDDGTVLTPVTVNGWQQGWVLPADTAGTVTLTFGSNAFYRAGLVGGLALLPVLALLAFLPTRRCPTQDEPPRVWRPGRVTASVAVLGVGALVSGLAGAAMVGAAML